MSTWATWRDRYRAPARAGAARRMVAGSLIAAVTVAFGSDGPAYAHGGPDGGPIASDFRTELTRVVPERAGLTVEVVDITGTLELSWAGPGEVLVLGYEAEPYLRVTSSSVERNLQSPAVYLNADASGTAPLPDGLDPDGPPQWEHVPGRAVARWHDHRVHWMSPILPTVVQADPGQSHVVFERWVVPLVVDGTPAEITGTLKWAPPPALAPWVVAAIVTAVVAAGVLRRSVRGGVAVAGAAVVWFAADSLGLALAATGGWANQVWVFRWPVVTGLLVAALYRRVTPNAGRHAPLAAGLSGLVLVLMGGFDRIEVLSRSQVYSAFPAVVSRVSTAAAIGVGAVLIGWFILTGLSARPAPYPLSLDPEQVSS